MIFKKISFLVLLVLCTTYPGEARNRCKQRNCGKREPNNVFQHNNELDNIYEQSESNAKNIFIGNKKSNATGVNKAGDRQSNIPLQYYEPHTIALDGNINWNTLSYPANNIGKQIPNDLNVDPYFTEALLKQMWLSNPLDNVTPRAQNLNFDIEPREVQSPSQSVLRREDYFMIPGNNVINNVDKQLNSEPSEFKLLNSLLEEQLNSNYNNGNSDFNENQNNDDNTDSDSNKDWDSNNDKNPFSYNNNDIYRAGVMPLGASLGEFQYNFPLYYDFNNIDKQKANIPLPQVIPVAEYSVENQQANISPSQVIPAFEFGADKHQGNIENYPQAITLKKNGYKDYVVFNNMRGHFPEHPRTYDNHNYNVPYKYDLKAIPDKEFIYKKYYDELKLENQQNNLPFNQKTVAYENFNNSTPYKYDSHHIFDEKRYRVPTTHIPPNRMPSTHQEPGKYSKWVLEQIEIINSNSQGLDDVDLSALEYSILQILSENGMYITDNGMLMDTYGTISNIDTLNLTPIIIGNKMSSKNLLEGEYGVMSSRLQAPYLQAILVSATDPLKILGIMPLETTYLPLSSLNSVTNIWGSIPKDLKSAKSGEDEVVDENEPKKDEPEKLNVKKLKKSIHNDADEEYYNLGHSSIHVNINGDNNSMGKSHLLKTFPSRQGFRSKDDLDDDRAYSKKYKNQDELESHGGSLFIPHIEFQEQPIDILTRHNNLPITVVASKIHEPARIHIPSVSSFVDIAFRSENTPANNIQSTQNNVAAGIPNEPAAVSDVFGKFSDTTKALLGLFKKDTHVSVGDKTKPCRRYQTVGNTASPILKWKKQDLQTIPLDYTDVSVLEEFDIGSRNRIQPALSDIPPENVHNGNNGFDLLEYYDDDDGDFRIIGGNAATGSGTPLSNKGRSGYVF